MFPCYANKTRSLSAGMNNGLFNGTEICGVFSFSSFSEGRTAGVWGSGCRPSNKKRPAIDAQIIGVNLQVTLLHNECLRKILRSLLKNIFNSVSLGNVSKG